MQMISILKHAVMISFFVFVMMLLVDFIEIASKGRMSGIIKGGRWRQYNTDILFGVYPRLPGRFYERQSVCPRLDILWRHRGWNDRHIRR
jgi:hypothetical protein